MRFVNAKYPLSELTRDVIAGFYRAYDTLGFGFLESPYRGALCAELRHAGLSVEREVPFDLFHPGRVDWAISGRYHRGKKAHRRSENGAAVGSHGNSPIAQLSERDATPARPRFVLRSSTEGKASDSPRHTRVSHSRSLKRVQPKRSQRPFVSGFRVVSVVSAAIRCKPAPSEDKRLYRVWRALHLRRVARYPEKVGRGLVRGIHDHRRHLRVGIHERRRE